MNFVVGVLSFFENEIKLEKITAESEKRSSKETFSFEWIYH